MPPSWLQRLSVDHSSGGLRSVLPDLEHADWSRALNASEVGGGGGLDPGAAAARATFAEGLLSTSNIALHGEVCALAVEPVLGFLAVGTTVGGIHLFGKDGVQVDWNLRPANKVQHLLFKSGSPLLVVIDAKDNVSVFDLSRNDPQLRAKTNAAPHPFQPTQSTSSGAGPSGPLHPDTPMRIGAHTARNGVLCAELSPLHGHLFIGLRDGTVDSYDLERLSPSPYRVPNLWWEEEEILRKSGVPDAPSRRHVPLLIDIKTRPNDINQLLLAYEGGMVLLDVGKRTVVKTFQLRHLPGVPGAGVGDPNLLWTERAAAATCVAWRPDGLMFACGHEDGCISFWHVEDDEKPIAVRTLETVDVDKPGVSEAMMNGQLPRSREPIFKLTWSGFPAQSWFAGAAGIAEGARPISPRTQPTHQQQQTQQKEEPATGTVLTVLGGATERHPPGLVCLHFPAFSWPYASYWNAKTPDALAKTRQALRASLEETKGSRYSTSSPVEDFLLIPRDSPYFGNAYDPVAVITLLAQDPTLPPLPPPAAARGLKAFAFPPPTDPRSLAGSTIHKDPGLGRIQYPFPQRELHLPLPLSTSGSGAVLGAKLIDVTPHVYRTLTAQSDGAGEGEKEEANATTSPAFDVIRSALQTANTDVANIHPDSLPLRGGRATPTATGTHADTAEAFATLARAQRWRLLLTWHLDGTVRLHDASPQLLLLGVDQSATLTRQDGKEAFTPGYLNKSFPCPLPHLTVDMRELAHEPSMNGHPLFERLKGDASRLRVVNVHFAPESMESAVTLRTGQVFHFKFGFARFSQTDEVVEAVAEEVQQDEQLAASMARRSSNLAAFPAPASMSAQELDQSMAGAMKDLNVGAAPARPRRDPKRVVDGERRRSVQQQQPTAPPPRMHVEEITNVGHLAEWRSDGFKPNIAVELGLGEVTALNLSDIGFLTIACGPALAVIDMRGPAIIAREGFGGGRGPDKDSLSREERKIVEEESKSGIQNVHVAICRTAVDPVLSPTLIVVRESGYATFWTLIKTPMDTWTCIRTHGQQFEELQRGVDVQVVDMAGNVSRAIPAELQRSLREQMRGGALAGESVAMDMNLMLCVGRQTITLRAGVCGPKIGKAEVSGEPIRAASVVDRRGDKVCVAVTLKSIYVYSLPKLRLITRVQRHNRAHEERLSIGKAWLSLDGSGDFVEVANSVDVCMWTVFAALARPGLPSLLLYTPPSMPLAPNMLGSVASSVVNWIGGKSSALSQGAQLDEMLAGGSGKRNSMPKLPEQKFVQERLDERERKAVVQEELARRAEIGGAGAGGRAAFTRSSAASPATARTAQQTNDAASSAAWTFDLAKQRGEMVSSLEQGLSNLERGASNWMKSAREDMIKQAAKDKISKFF